MENIHVLEACVGIAKVGMLCLQAGERSRQLIALR